MAIRSFPPVELADKDGLLCAGGDLEVESLLLAYRNGIFPWPVSEDYPLVWFSPPMRALIFLDDVHIPKSLKRARAKTWRFTIDQAFEEVIDGCANATNRRRGGGTWILPKMIAAYTALHCVGWCHSVEAWRSPLEASAKGGESELAGGLYGVSIGRMFAGESMFYKTANASKLALWYLIDYLRERGAKWVDCQQLTPLVASFGAREVPRDRFLELLAEAVDSTDSLFR